MLLVDEQGGVSKFFLPLHQISTLPQRTDKADLPMLH
jgi:hypothetical protein